MKFGTKCIEQNVVCIQKCNNIQGIPSTKACSTVYHVMHFFNPIRLVCVHEEKQNK